MLRRLMTLVGVSAFLVGITLGVQALFDLAHIPLVLLSPKGPGQVLFYLLMIGGLWAFVRYIWNPRGLPAAWASYRDPANRSRLLRGFALTSSITLASTAIGYMILFQIGGASFDANAAAHVGLKTIGGILGAGIVALVLVTTEEFIFRAIVYNYLRGGRRDDDTAIAAALLSAMVFALAHGAQFGFRWLAEDKERLFIGLFLLGVLIALIYEYSGSLLPGMGIHVGLIWSEIIRVHTRMVLLDPTKWWMGGGTDPRMDPYIWMLFLLLTVAVCLGRRKLQAFAAVEPGKRER